MDAAVEPVADLQLCAGSAMIAEQVVDHFHYLRLK